MHFIQIQDFFHKNMHVIRKKELLTARSAKCSVSEKFSPMLVETPYFGGVINPKTYLNHELGYKFFFLSDLAYKLVNLLVIENFSCTIEHELNVSKNYWSETQLYQ